MHIRHLNKTDMKKNSHLLKINPTCHHKTSIKFVLPFLIDSHDQ